MTANVRAITIRQPYAWAIVKKGDPSRSAMATMCGLIDVVITGDDR